MQYETQEDLDEILSMDIVDQIGYLLEVCNVRAIDIIWDILFYCGDKEWVIEQVIRDNIEVVE